MKVNNVTPGCVKATAKQMKTDRLMDALKAFEVNGLEEIRGGYYTIIYKQGRAPGESHGTIYDAKDHVYSASYYSSAWEALHPSGIIQIDGIYSGPSGGTNIGAGGE